MRACERSAAAARAWSAAAARSSARRLGRPDALVRGGPRRSDLRLGGALRLGDLRLGGAKRLGDLGLSGGPRRGDLGFSARRDASSGPLRLSAAREPRRPPPRRQLRASAHGRLRVCPRLGQLRPRTVLELRPGRAELGLPVGQLRTGAVELGGGLVEPAREVAAGGVEVRRSRDRLLAGPRRLRRRAAGPARAPRRARPPVAARSRAQRRRAGLARLEHPQPHGVAGPRHLRRPHPELQIARPAPGRRRGRQRVGQRSALVLVAGRPPLQLRRARRQRVALGDQGLHPRLELRAAQLQRVQRPQRLRRHPRLRLLGRLGAPGAALRHHGAVDDLAARLRPAPRRRPPAPPAPRARRAPPATGSAERSPPSHSSHTPDRAIASGSRYAPRHTLPVPATPARRVGQRLVARHPAADRRAQHRQALGPRRPGRPPPAHAHEPGVSAGRQPLDRLEREAVENRGRGGFRHRRDGPRRSGGFPPEPKVPGSGLVGVALGQHEADRQAGRRPPRRRAPERGGTSARTCGAGGPWRRSRPGCRETCRAWPQATRRRRRARAAPSATAATRSR